MSGIELREGGGRRWAALNLESMGATGRLNPRLLLYFTAQPEPYAKATLDDVTLRLEYQNELVGAGRVTSVDVHRNDTPVNFEVVTSAQLLRFITDTLISNQTVVQFDAKLSGAASYWVDPASSSQGRVRMTNDSEPGTWTRFQVFQGSSSYLQLSRSEWYERVLAPTRNEQYLHLEVALPRDHPALMAEWNRAMSHLRSAEKAYAVGDDPGVFQYLRGWLDALPGAKQHILDSISNEKKRRDLDDLLVRAGAFLHNGRHVAAARERSR